jgi:hypothetical protein
MSREHFRLAVTYDSAESGGGGQLALNGVVIGLVTVMHNTCGVCIAITSDVR